MGAQRTTFAKLQRERAKKAKAAAKRERRLERDDSGPRDDVSPAREGGELTAAQLLERVEQIHRQYEAKQLTHEDYEEQKADLLARLPID